MEKFRGFSCVRSFVLATRADFFRRLLVFLQTKCKVFELTTQRFKITCDVFTKTTETLELYRVETRQPFFSRLVGIETVQMATTDASSPVVVVDALPSSVRFADKLRNQVEIIRQQKTGARDRHRVAMR